MRFLKRKFTGRGYSKEWDEAIAAYWQYWDRIKSSLPDSARALHRVNLHDEVMEDFRATGRNVCIETGYFTLWFTGVEATNASSRLIGAIWLYDELHPFSCRKRANTLGDAGFELNVLFYDPDEDVVIKARDVACFDKASRRWIIGQEPAPETETGMRKRHHRK